MSIIASCGCELTEAEGFGISLYIKDNNKSGDRCISYMCVCNDCYDRYENMGLICYTKEDEEYWLDNDK